MFTRKNSKKYGVFLKFRAEKRKFDSTIFVSKSYAAAFFHQTFVSKSKTMLFQFWYNTISGTDFSHQTHSFLVTFFCSVRNVRNCDKDQYFFENQPTVPCKIIFELFPFLKRPDTFCKK